MHLLGNCITKHLPLGLSNVINSLAMMLLTCALLCLVAFSECKKAVQTEVVTVKDIKEWKKELRTKKNVLSVFLQTSKKGSDVQDLVADVSVRMRGRATVIVIDCGSATKLCKKLKVREAVLF